MQEHLQANVCCRFLELAIGYERAPANETLRSDWEARDLRYVYLLSDGSVGPLCPAAFQGISSALMELALEDDVQDASVLIQQLEKAIAADILSPSALGFAQEHIFLTKLALRRNFHITARLSSSASPTGLSGGTVFMFERVQMIWNFGTRSKAVAKYSQYQASVLFIPREQNEQYIDAAVYDYHTKSIYAIQVGCNIVQTFRALAGDESRMPTWFRQVTGQTMQQHKSSLDFFTEASHNRWQNLVPNDEADEWTDKNMVWVLTNVDLPSDGPASAEDDRYQEVKQYQISYDDFVRGRIVDPQVLRNDVRGQSCGFNEETIQGQTVKQLKAFCKSRGIRGVLQYKLSELIATIKDYMGWELTDDDQVVKVTLALKKEAAHQTRAAVFKQMEGVQARKRYDADAQELKQDTNLFNVDDG